MDILKPNSSISYSRPNPFGIADFGSMTSVKSSKTNYIASNHNATSTDGKPKIYSNLF